MEWIHGRRETIARWALAIIAIAVGLLRLKLCFELPSGTSDLLRHVLWAFHVTRDGLLVGGQPLAALDPSLANIPFSQNPYNYPPVALGFFSACSVLRPCLLVPKLALTFLEAINSILLARLAGRAWVGILYWAAPLSIWVVSGEGQFEPLQNFFVLAAVSVFQRRPALAFALAGLAVQTKVTGGAILIYFIWESFGTGLRTMARHMAALAVSFLPTLVVQSHFPSIQQVLTYSTEFPQNPIYWNFLNAAYHGIYKPGWVAYSQVISWALLGLLACEIRRGVPWHRVGPGILHVLYLKTSPSLLPWYWLVLPSVASPAASARSFGLLCLLVGIADFPAVFLTSSSGPYDPALYRGIQAWTDIRTALWSASCP